MRIAVASTNGKDIDEHFGKAREFLVYDLAGGKAAFVARRRTTPLSTGGKPHTFDDARFRLIAEAILDCARVYAVNIGDRPKLELEKLGITAVCREGRIEDIA